MSSSELDNLLQPLTDCRFRLVPTADQFCLENCAVAVHCGSIGLQPGRYMSLVLTKNFTREPLILSLQLNTECVERHRRRTVRACRKDSTHQGRSVESRRQRRRSVLCHDRSYTYQRFAMQRDVGRQGDRRSTPENDLSLRRRKKEASDSKQERPTATSPGTETPSGIATDIFP
jgi:hypothetical protein